MVANGWTAEQAFMPTMLPFAKGDRSASVIIGEEGEGLVSVVVMTE